MKLKLILLLLLILQIACKKNQITMSADEPSIELIFDSSEPEFQVGAGLGLNYYNDITVGVINLTPTNIKLITAAGAETIIMEGSNLHNISSAYTVLRPSRVIGGSSSAIDYNYIGLGQLIKTKTNKYYGLYHAEWHDGSVLNAGVAGFYASIGLCTSTNGVNFTKSSAAVVPNIYNRAYDNGAGDGGYGEPSMLFNKDSSEVYVYFVDHNRTGLGVNISMAKFNVLSNGEPDFSTCYFLTPYNTFTSQIIRPAQVVMGANNDHAINPQVTYSKWAKKYLMVYNLNAWEEWMKTGSSPSSGTYLTTSDDGIIWNSKSQLLKSDYAIPLNSTTSFSWHPNLIFTDANQKEGYLLYSKSVNGLGAESHKMYAKKFRLVLK